MKNINKLGFSIWRSLILIFTILSSNNLFATFHVAGYINCNYVSGYTYKISVVTYTNIITFIDESCDVTVHISNGDSIILNRINGINGTCIFPSKMGEYIGEAINLNIFEGIYTFPNQNLFTLSMNYGHRYSSIINISNSIPQAFYLETKLFVFNPSNYCVSSNSNFAALPITKASINTKYESDVPINYTDGDSLTYQLTPCMNNGDNIMGYTIPSDMTINPHTGRITWLQPNQLGQWSFAVLVKKWRQNILVGTSLLDYTIEVVTTPSTTQNITVNTNCNQNNDSTYSCNINSTDTVKITITNPNSTISLYTEIDTTNKYSFQNDTATFIWNTTIANARHNPYKFTFRHNKMVNNELQTKDITFFIIVNDTTNQTCPITPNLSTIKIIEGINDIIIYPNPATNQLNIQCNHCDLGSNLNKIVMYDASGKQVLNSQITGKQNVSIDTQAFANGNYTYQILNDNQNTISKGKLVIEHK